MKKKERKSKLALRKETIAPLNSDEMHEIHGGSVCPPSSLCLTITNTTVIQKVTTQTCG
jgi:hypothetical protein